MMLQWNFGQVFTHMREDQFKANSSGCCLKASIPHEGLLIGLVMTWFPLDQIIRERKERELKREPTVFSINSFQKWHVTTCAICYLLITKINSSMKFKDTAQEWIFPKVRIILEAIHSTRILEQVRYWKEGSRVRDGDLDIFSIWIAVEALGVNERFKSEILQTSYPQRSTCRPHSPSWVGQMGRSGMATHNFPKSLLSFKKGTSRDSV